MHSHSWKRALLLSLKDWNCAKDAVYFQYGVRAQGDEKEPFSFIAAWECVWVTYMPLRYIHTRLNAHFISPRECTQETQASRPSLSLSSITLRLRCGKRTPCPHGSKSQGPAVRNLRAGWIFSCWFFPPYQVTLRFSREWREFGSFSWTLRRQIMWVYVWHSTGHFVIKFYYTCIGQLKFWLSTRVTSLEFIQA